jgi:plastocyanin
VAAVVALLALGGILFVPIDDDPALPSVEVTMTEYAFAPDPITVEPGQELAVVNAGELPHSLVIGELGKGVELAAGGSGSLLVPADADGTYQVICDITGHVDLGMVTTIVVG